MIKKIKCFSASASNGINTPIHITSNEYKYPTEIIKNNSQSLAKVYNDILEDCRRSGTDVVVFVHDDVFINCRDMLDRISFYSDKFDVFGVAGCKNAKIASPALWHLMSERSSHRGCVAHGDRTQYNYTSFGPIPDRVLLLDGVFLAINLNSLPHSVKFDERNPSKFHFYDLDFSLNCNDNKLKLGVGDIPIIHKSPGLQSFTREFKQGENYFINKWIN